jgi:CheY-like chemotaxis protein
LASILIVEDEPTWQRLLRKQLKFSSNQIVTVSTIEEALQSADNPAYDVIVFDLKLDPDPGNLFKSLQKMIKTLEDRSRLPIPIVVVTGEHPSDKQLRSAINLFGGWLYGFILKQKFDEVEYSEIVSKAAQSHRDVKLDIDNRIRSAVENLESEKPRAAESAPRISIAQATGSLIALLFALGGLVLLLGQALPQINMVGLLPVIALVFTVLGLLLFLMINPSTAKIVIPALERLLGRPAVGDTPPPTDTKDQ